MYKKDLNIFISSSEQELKNEREIAFDVLNDFNMGPILFELSPAQNMAPHTAYLQGVDECSVFITILYLTFPAAVKREYLRAVERSKPIIVLVRTCNYNERRSPELISFLDNLREAESPDSTIRISCYREFQNLKTLKKELINSISYEISKFYQDPIATLTRDETYLLGADIITQSQKRLFIFQNTPTLILGTKNIKKEGTYSKTPFNPAEEQFFNCLSSWIDKNKDNPNVEFYYLYSKTLTKKEIKTKIPLEDSEIIHSRIKERLKFYSDLEERTNFRFRFIPLDTPVSGPFIIGDNRYAYWLMGYLDSVSISQENAKIATTMIKMIKYHSIKTYSYEQLVYDLFSPD